MLEALRLGQGSTPDGENTLTAVLGDLAEDRKTETKKAMDKYVCITCGWVYDPEEGDPEGGIAPGTAFEDIPEDWTCPACGVGKEFFEKV